MNKTEDAKKPPKPAMGGRAARMMPGEKAKDFKGTFRQFCRYMGNYKISVVIVMIFAMASTVFMILGPKILGNATTLLVEGVMSSMTGTGSGIDYTGIANILLFLLGIYILSSVFSFIQGLIMTNVSMKLTYKLRKDISEKLNRLPIKFFDKTTNGEILSRITNDVDTLSQTLNQSLTQIITSVTQLVGVLIMMFLISWQMTLIAIAILPVSLIFVLGVVKKSQKQFVAQQKYLGHVNGHIEEMYGGHQVMKAFNGEEKSIEVFDRYNESLYTAGWKSQFLSGIMMPIMVFVTNLGYVAVCILGGFFAANKVITIGDIQAFLQYVRQFTQPITQVANITNILQQTAAAAERVFEFLNEEEEAPESENAITVNTGDAPDTELNITVDGSVQFAHIHFGYSDDKIVINDFSADIRSGSKIAIVGPTGAGKTTIVKLLMRFYDVQGGAVLIDGYDIRDFRRHDLRSIFGMVLQDTWLYSGTIMDNLRYGNFDATDEEVKKAAKAAQVDYFVSTLPGGYDMQLNEETNNISQGQKQLITIARAILSDPKILILDEATSSVDTRTEVMIQKAMDNLMKGRTSFIIAHRLSTIKNADVILVLDKGNIVEQGSHEELMKKGGFYEKLYNSQFETA